MCIYIFVTYYNIKLNFIYNNAFRLLYLHCIKYKNITIFYKLLMFTYILTSCLILIKFYL